MPFVSRKGFCTGNVSLNNLGLCTGKGMYTQPNVQVCVSDDVGRREYCVPTVNFNRVLIRYEDRA